MRLKLLNKVEIGEMVLIPLKLVMEHQNFVAAGVHRASL